MVATQILANALIAGAIYALVACGFSLIYSTNRLVHFAHGATVAVGAYALFAFFKWLSFDFWLSAALAITVAALAGWVMNEFVYKPLRKRHTSTVILMVASFGLLILAESLLLILFGADVKTVDVFPIARGLDIAGAIITPLQILIVLVSLALLAGLFLLMKFSRLGKSFRAVSDNLELAEISGISSKKVFAQSFVIGSALAGVAGILIGLEQNLEPTMGTHLVIKGFTGAVIGGISSVPGAVLGSFLLGLAENVGVWFLPSGYKDAIAFAVLFVFLLVRPQGILGIKKGDDK
jgi:branched-subunit amino acid ABC-type transport system permease component